MEDDACPTGGCMAETGRTDLPPRRLFDSVGIGRVKVCVKDCVQWFSVGRVKRSDHNNKKTINLAGEQNEAKTWKQNKKRKVYLYDGDDGKETVTTAATVTPASKWWLMLLRKRERETHAHTHRERETCCSKRRWNEHNTLYHTVRIEGMDCAFRLFDISGGLLLSFYVVGAAHLGFFLLFIGVFVVVFEKKKRRWKVRVDTSSTLCWIQFYETDLVRYCISPRCEFLKKKCRPVFSLLSQQNSTVPKNKSSQTFENFLRCCWLYGTSNVHVCDFFSEFRLSNLIESIVPESIKEDDDDGWNDDAVGEL